MHHDREHDPYHKFGQQTTLQSTDKALLQGVHYTSDTIIHSTCNSGVAHDGCACLSMLMSNPRTNSSIEPTKTKRQNDKNKATRPKEMCVKDSAYCLSENTLCLSENFISVKCRLQGYLLSRRRILVCIPGPLGHVFR